ncbi:xanthine dehydrogenase family protein molybdopterin-binding subunit [Terasakiella sp. A23]|uniref:xanthine dehydrogenase family protein molybdopterin-binding subunit n=1 Tax=Terasakiella sp. FCG-A23 TaxID=3080561 RepID=UPI0029545BCA|nr:xanthine dehydrogenase family protein molybdopterin-binding subunit [Terasakiella sp. A23]MDV7341264.1 xanthine dehydrogenase family protein molybdopterin-binding subunit [Terasakiella sp. A23]
MTIDVSRRGFLKGAATAGAAALFVGTGANNVLAAGSEEVVFNPFVKIDADGTVTVIVKHFEMGQGTTTGLTTLVAEELDADWEQIKVDFAPADASKYNNLHWGPMQGTGGSSAIANSFQQYRKAGATARELLVRAASQKWGVEESLIRVEKGVLSVGNRSAGFGAFVHRASTLEASPEPTLKKPEDFTLIGNQNLPRKDNTDKTDGTAIFAQDVSLPGMVTVVVKRSPKFGGTLTGFDAAKAQNVSGFIDAKALPNKAGVAVYAQNTWAAFQARDAVDASWDFSKAETRSNDELMAIHTEAAKSPQYLASKVSADVAAAEIAKAETVVEGEFTFPFLAHAPMETLNCVIEPTAKGVRFHDGCQAPTFVQGAVAHILNLLPENVEVNTVYAGGSFGRRATPNSDYQSEAAMAFDLLGRKVPVKLIWSREDDIRGGRYRPMFAHNVSVGLDKAGDIVGWKHGMAGKSILISSPFEQFMVKDGVDETSVEGVAHPLYNIPQMSAGVSNIESAVPVLWWRSVGHTHTAYAMESMLDMVADKAGRDPIDLRLSLLDESDAKQKRLAGVIKAARDAAGWKKGDKRGFASHFSFNSYVAVVADVSVDGSRVHVDKLHIAVDCGVAVNPDVVIAQMEGGAGYGLGHILRDEITLENGEVVQENFPDYEPLRMSDMPEIEVTIVASAEAPTGVGEPGTPPTGPAVANAIFAMTGKRITHLPMTKSGFEFV